MPVRFVGELSANFTKVAISNGLCQLVVFEHTSHAQIFDGYHRLVFAEIARELMRSITADVGNVGMLPGNLFTGLFAILAAKFAV